ncbi:MULTISPECIES: MFS transporter [unclassified Erwinia]|uniref:MFS transporter n=1 Tax=unclassified Erwinia TaxID=2622719 RepID=UPI00083249C8|nr:MFS transporter [Erwinia sp. ErVv1]
MKTLPQTGGFTLMAVACLTIMVGCVIVPGLPSISRHLGVEDAAGWLVTLPALGVVLFGPLAGRIVDRAGLTRSLHIGLFLYGLFGAGGAFLHGHWAVFTDRLLLGMPTALVMSSGTALISSFYHGEARMRMIARQGMSIELGGVIFLFLAGLLATAGWRWPFTLYLLAWVLLAMVLAFIPGDPHTAPEETAASPRAKTGALRLTYTAALFSMICFFTAIILLPLHFNAIGVSEAQTGYFLSFVSLIAVFAAWLMPELVRRLSGRVTLALAFTLYAVGHLLFAFAPSMPFFVPGGIVMGCAFGFSVPLVNHLMVQLSSPAQRGRNLARLSMALFLGQFLAGFMGYLPGNSTAVFTAAALIAAAMAALTFAYKPFQ